MELIKLDPLHVDKNDTFRAQINPNGLIYLLKHTEFSPVQVFETQPYGYPLEPVREAATGQAGARLL